nr:hypothetical protein Q903MT_gene2269 [Picea sitchensis]
MVIYIYIYIVVALLLIPSHMICYNTHLTCTFSQINFDFPKNQNLGIAL